MTLEETLAQAIADEFWRTAERPKTWAMHGHLERQVWMNCAIAAVAAGKAFKAKSVASESRMNLPTPTSRGST